MVDTLALGASANGMEVRVLFKAILSCPFVSFQLRSKIIEKNVLTGLVYPSYNNGKKCCTTISYSIFSYAPPSSRGLGHFPFTEVTGIRIPLGVEKE